MGWIHGILFILYCYLVILAGQEYKWSFGKTSLAFLAAFLPFGPFLFDRVYLREKN
jgi:integral membrane protein